MGEDWDETPQFSLKKVLLVVILISALVGSAVAVYKIVSPPSDQVVVTEPATLSKPTVNATSAIVGDTIQLSTRLSDNSEGQQVFFLANGNSIGSAYTDSTGQAIFNHVNVQEGTYVYTAECTHS